jgi:monofunctional biosynthetic peptidoglycan transglycosylase
MAHSPTLKIRSAIAVALFACLPAVAGEPQSVAEFAPEESQQLDWRIVDDGVMGGLSQGKREISKDGVLRFFGTLSLENNGGFSSLRTGAVKLDLSGAEGIIMRVKGDGRSYQLRLGTDAEYRGREMSFQAGFATTKDEWTEVKMPYGSFVGTWRGTELPDTTFDPAKVRRLGLQLADKKAGPFELQVDWIRCYGGGDPTGVDARTHLKQGALVIDVRSPREYNSEHLPSAVNIPVDGIETALPVRVPDKNKVLLLHCQSGMRSAVAMKKLKSIGYTHVYNLGSLPQAKAVVDDVDDK